MLKTMTHSTDIRAALARWSRPATPPAPEVGEVGELVAYLQDHGTWLIQSGYANASIDTRDLGIRVFRAAALLQRLSAPAPAVVPVAVSERPYDQEGWCDERGYCWRFDPCPDGWWSYGRPTNFMGDHEECWTHMAPHNAIPLPQAGEVEA
jgi:hypothetical protein